MRIDRDEALAILEAEAASTASIPEDWESLVSQLSEECESGANKTFIAMLGTALLARATDIRADPFTLKSGSGAPGAYSARALCQHVLAAHAPRLGIDLGVTGREPLNNQPFFAEDRVHEGMPVHHRATVGFSILMDCLGLISRIQEPDEARDALRAFLVGRRLIRYQGQLDLEQIGRLSSKKLAEIVEQFVSANSEYGRRAQAVVAGILDSTFTCDIFVSHVHDPDRHFPGDVNVVREEKTVIAFEVRDKAVNGPDAYHFVNKASAAGVPSAGIVAVAANQEVLDDSSLRSFSDYHSVNLHLFYSWHEFIAEASFWGDKLPDWRSAIEQIHARALELEVSEPGIQQWESLARR